MRNFELNDKEFLINLQNELNTQDHVGQADPRFWVVRGSKKVWVGEEYGSESALITCDGDICIDELSIENFIEWLKKEYQEELEAEKITFDKKSNYWMVYAGEQNEYGDYDEDLRLFDCNDLFEFCQDHKILSDDYAIDYYNVEEFNYSDTFFMTFKECEEHIEKNHYHYSSDAHPYAMTAWRSPEVEKLWKLLQEVNWEEIECKN